MNDLLKKTAEFFFIPEAALSSVFLIIFVGIFAFGVYRQRKCQEFLRAFDAEAEENFKALSMKMTPEMFIKKNLRKISVAEDVLEELPNVFVSIGIVATFLGLGVAIQGAAELLQTDKLELPKLTAVLGVIAFKFQTSVWGICFSIIFRNIICERYFEIRRQLIDEITDRLYMLERENARTLIERQNELIVAQHKEILAANAEHNLALVERLTAFENAVTEQTRQLSETERENAKNLIERQNELLIKRLTTFETIIHGDNLVAKEYLNYIVNNFKTFFRTVDDFAKNELAFSKSVEAFTQRVKIFQEEFAELVHKEMADLKAINENLGRIHAEHIQKIHDEHASNIFYTTQELDKLHQKFYLDAERFAEESRKMLDNLLDTTLGRVHDEYTHEAHEIRVAITEINSTLSTIKNNVETVNQEFTAEQKHFVDSWHLITNRISETMAALTADAAKENERLEIMQKVLEDVAHNMQSNSADNFERINAFMQNTADNFKTLMSEQNTMNTANLSEMSAQSKEIADNFKTIISEQNTMNAAHLSEMSAQSKAMTDNAKALRENISELALNNQIVTENLSGELLTVKDALENLIATINAERDNIKKVSERFPATDKKLIPLGTATKSKSNTVDGRGEK